MAVLPSEEPGDGLKRPEIELFTEFVGLAVYITAFNERDTDFQYFIL
jgi:hypothetical protein